jgi:tRNA(Ile)-lysidine synthase
VFGKRLWLQWFSPGTTWGVGVSGGGDSLALLHLLVSEFGPAPWRVVHVNHGWDKAFSAAAARRVREVCAALGVPLTVKKVTGGKPKTNPEARARAQRYTAFSEVCAAQKLAGMVLGHTRSDQAEQFLLRAGKGSGLTGLAGIPKESQRDKLRVVRPLLGLGREELRVYLRQNKVAWVEDPGNPLSARGKIREKLAGGWLDEAALAASVTSLARAEGAIEQAVDGWLAADRRSMGGRWADDGRTMDGWRVSRPELLALPEEIALRVLARLIKLPEEDFAPRTRKRGRLLAEIGAKPQGAATLGQFKLRWDAAELKAAKAPAASGKTRKRQG